MITVTWPTFLGAIVNEMKTAETLYNALGTEEIVSCCGEVAVVVR